FGNPHKAHWIINREWADHRWGLYLDQFSDYGDFGLHVHSGVSCPARLADFWSARATLQLASGPTLYPGGPQIRSPESSYGAFDYRGVKYIPIGTRITFGDLWLALGAPEANLIEPSGFRSVIMVEHNASYFGGTLHAIRSPITCSIPLHDYWDRPVELFLVY